MLSNKVVRLAESAKYDVCLSTCSSGAGGRPGRSRKPENPLHEWIYPASVPGRGKVHILKILQSNKCRNRCTYCKFSASNDSEERTSLSPDELARSFIRMVQLRLVEGIFISSGVCNSPSFSMNEMVKTADILRNRYRFTGYIHLKIIPGAPLNLIEAAASLADRLSINMEAPSSEHLGRIAPDKSLDTEILPAASAVGRLLKERASEPENPYRIRARSQTTQYVVGASDESDMDIMRSVDSLYRDYFMFRAYFSAYQDRHSHAAAESIRKVPFAGSPLLREHRLYQCDFLLRAYGFRLPDLVFDRTGNIPLETDPKTAWAFMNREVFPVEINTAPTELLLRVPGIGPTSAERITVMRSRNKFRTIEDLKETGAWTGRAAGWIELDGKAPVPPSSADCRRPLPGRDFNPSQKWLFEEIAPEGWRHDPEAGRAAVQNRQAAADCNCSPAPEPYPGQKGKWVNYRLRSDEKKIKCR